MIKAKQFIFLATSAATLLLIGCKSDPTEIYGRVVDKKTGEPIEGAQVTFCENIDANPGCYEIGSELTDLNGNFSFIDKSGERIISINHIFKEGYFDWAAGKLVKMGTQNYPELQILPMDGLLKLRIEHLLNSSDTVYVSLLTEAFYSIGGGGYYHLSDYPLILQQGQFKEYYYPLPAELYSDILWGITPFTYDDAEHKSSLDIIKNDTTYYTITF